jgi:DNA-binding NarL/FixJ family response regulator
MCARHRGGILRGVPLRCLIVDDDAPFLEASRAILEGPAITVVGLAQTAAEGLQCAERLTPDVILADIDLRGDSGFELARKLADGPGANSDVILISTHAEEDFVDLVAESPAIGFVAKAKLSASGIQELVRRRDGRP